MLPRLRPQQDVLIERLFIEQNHSPFAEAIRSIRNIRSDVLLSRVDSPQKVVLLASSLPEEGKTTVASSTVVPQPHPSERPHVTWLLAGTARSSQQLRALSRPRGKS